MSAHTPGPWEVHSFVESMEHTISAPGWDDLAVVYGNEDDNLNKQGSANAHLIAAAPALLDAWVEFLSAQRVIDEAGFMDNYTDAARARERQQRAVVVARAAIARAEGKS